jgi:septation ring formation regulator EzrA
MKLTEEAVDSADIPKKVKQFRSIVNGVKRNILNRSESYNDSANDIQSAHNLNDITHRIRQFGTLLNMILDGTEHEKAEDVLKHFAKHSLDLSTISDEDRGLCKHYVHMDIFTYPYDLNPGHINSVSKIGNA